MWILIIKYRLELKIKSLVKEGGTSVTEKNNKRQNQRKLYDILKLTWICMFRKFLAT